MSELQQNEIRDYLERAPKKWYFRDGQMVNTTYVRLKWLTDLSRGTIDEKINRRAGIAYEYKPWKYPVGSSCRRHHRNELRKRGIRPIN